MVRAAPKFEDIGEKAPAFEDIGKAPAFEDIGKETYKPPITGEGRFRGVGATGTWKELTPTQKAGQAIVEAVAAPVRTVESWIGSIGGLGRMAAESATIGGVVTKHIDMPGVGIIAEHLIRRYGPKKALSFYDRKMQKHADNGKKISDYWNEQANKGWEAPNPDIVEARWAERPASKFVSVTSSGLTSMGAVIGTTYLTGSPHPGLALLAGSETGAMYDRLRNEGVPPGIASKLAQMAGAWTYGTEKVGFGRLMKPSKGKILKSLAKPGWEGAQEVAEGIGHNFLEYFGYDYRKPQDIPTAVKAGFDHAMDDWFDNLVGGVGSAGITSAVLHRGIDRGRRPSRPALPETEASPTLALFHGTFDVSATQKEGIVADKTRTGSVSATDDPGFARMFGADVVRIVIPSNAQGKILDITVDKNEATAISKGFPVSESYNPETTNPIARKQQLVGLDALSPEQKKWLTDKGYIGVKFLTTMAGEPSAKTEVRFAKNIPPSWIKERVEPIVLPTPQGITGKPLDEIVPQTADHAIGHQYGLTNKQVDSRLKQAELRYRELKSKDVNKRSLREINELAFLSRKRSDIEALIDWETGPKANAARRLSKLPAPKIPVPKAQMGKKRLLALGHKIKKNAGLVGKKETAYRDLAEKITGKRSMKDMDKAQMTEFVSALEEAYGAAKELLPEDYDKTIMVVGKPTTMRKIYGEAIRVIEKLKSRKKISDVVKKPSMWTRIWESTKGLGRSGVGINNTPVFHLARILDGGEEGIFSIVLDKNTENGLEIQDGHTKQVTEYIVKRLGELGVTDDDLTKMGSSVNPGLITEKLKGVPTEILDVEITGEVKNVAKKRTYQVTMAELIDIYLITNQEDGMRHLTKGGLIINGVETGKLSEAQIRDLRHRVEGDRKAEIIVETILEIGKVIWTPSLNNVSERTEGKKIATRDKWWHLEVYMPRKLPGEVEPELGKIKRKDINLLEDKGMFRDRTKSGAPLIVRDAFNRFNALEGAIAEYVGMAEASRISRTLLNDPDIAAILDQKGYGKVRENILTIHDRAQSTPRPEGNLSAWFTRRLANLYRAVLHYSPEIATSQYTSSWNYGAYVSPEYLYTTAPGYISWTKMQETMDLSDFAWNRFHMARSSLEMGEAARTDAALRMWTGGKASDKNKTGWAMKMADLAALTKGMNAAQKEYQVFKRDGKLTGLSEEWWLRKKADDLPDADLEMYRRVKEREPTIEQTPLTEEEQTEYDAVKIWKQVVSERAKYLWQRTQPSWNKWNRSTFTSEAGLKRVFFLFRSFHEKSLTIFNEAVLDYQHSARKSGDVGRFTQKIGHVFAGYAINAAMRGGISAVLISAAATAWTGELKWKRKEWGKYIEESMLTFLAAFPLAGPLLKKLIIKFIDDIADLKPGYVGKAIDSYPIEVVNDLLSTPFDLVDGVTHSINGENEKAMDAYERGFKKILLNVALLHGIPAYQLKRLGKPKEPKPKKPTQKKW